MLKIRNRIEGIKVSYVQMSLFCCMVAGYFCFGYVDLIGPLSLGVVSLIVLFLISCLNYCIDPGGRFPNKHVTISTVLILLVSYIYIVSGEEFVLFLRRAGVPIILIFSVRGTIRSVRQANIALVIIAIIVSISCIFAVLQAFNVELFWDLRMMLGTADRAIVMEQLVNRVKAPGLAYFAVPLSYQISAIFPFVIYLTHIYRDRKWLIIFALCLVLGAIASKSLSSILSMVISYIVFMKLNLLLSRKKLIGFVVVIIFLSIGISHWNDLAARIITPDHSTLCRIPFTLMGLEMLPNVPFGVEGGVELTNLMRNSLTYYGNLTGARDIYEFGFHNCLLNLVVYYGWAVLMGYIWLYLYIFRFSYKAMKNSIIGSTDHYFYSGAIAYYCAYIIQSVTHNGGLTSGDVYDWVMIAVILAYKPSQVSSERL